MTDERPLTYLLAVVWTICVLLMLLAQVEIMTSVRPHAANDIVTLGATEAIALLLGMFAVLRLHAPEASFQKAVGMRRTHPGLIALGMALGVVAHFPAESVRILVERYYPTPPEVLAQRIALLQGDTVAQKIAVLLVVACVGPLVEELFFRGALFTVLRRSKALLGTSIVTAVTFVILHLEPRLWPPLLIVAAVLTHLRAASGSLMPCLALHVTFNAVTVLALFTGVSSATAPTDIDPSVLAAGWILTAGLVLWVQVLSASSDEAAQARAEDSA